jgi:hypothetical protein
MACNWARRQRARSISADPATTTGARRLVEAPCMLRADPRRGDTTALGAAIFSLDRATSSRFERQAALAAQYLSAQAGNKIECRRVRFFDAEPLPWKA